MKTYRGARSADGHIVTCQDGGGGAVTPLAPRFDLRFHFPGFDWGWDGLGAAQLALALLADHLEDDRVALCLHQDFKIKVVGRLPNDWTMTSDQVDAIVAPLQERSRWAIMGEEARAQLRAAVETPDDSAPDHA